MANARRKRVEELPPDNTARVALFDVMADASEADTGFDGLNEDGILSRAIPRLRVLVPRELHNQGEQTYVAAKVAACVKAGLLQPHPRRPGYFLLGPHAPRVRYPDGTVREYTPGLEAARERLESDEARLRRGGFEVRRIVRSPADAKKSDRYRNLVASMREHGFLEQCPVITSASGEVLDGVARLAAAAEADVPIKDKHRVPLRRRDTPLQHALLVLHLNADRLSDEDVSKTHEAIAGRTGRSWIAIMSDLDLTRDWRRAEPKDYDAKFEVELVRYAGAVEPRVQITKDGTRVMLRSVMREAGLPEYARDDLRAFVAFEEARTQLTGRKAIFVRVSDAIGGIQRMQSERQRRDLKIDAAWDDIREWLRSLGGAPPGSSEGGASASSDVGRPLGA